MATRIANTRNGIGSCMAGSVGTCLNRPPVDSRDPAQRTYYATWNPFDKASGVLLSNNNKTVQVNVANAIRANLAKRTGKWFWTVSGVQANAVGNPIFGVSLADASLTAMIGGPDGKSWGFYPTTGNKQTGNSASAYTTGVAVGAKKWGVALDCDAHTISIYSGSTNLGVMFSGLPDALLLPIVGGSSSGTIPTYAQDATCNFGQDAFDFVPAGFNPGLFV